MAARPGALLAAAAFLLGCDPASEAPSSSTVPELVSPAPGAVMDNGCVGGTNPFQWTFDWTDVPGADLYQLYVTRSGMNPAIDKADLTASDFMQHDTAWILNENLDGWSWKVRARANGVWGEWSAERPFAVESVGTDCP
jgi:hypothetical protein